MMLPYSAAANRQLGFSLIEILVTLLITAFGLLALAGFVTKATTLTADSTQRARAGTLLSDMASRIANHKAAIAADYLIGTTTYVDGASAQNCEEVKTEAARDLCEWNNLLAGANDGGGNAASLGYRGCITRPKGDPNVYIVTVAWGSLTPGFPPVDECGKDEFGDESFRRIIRLQVRVASLSAK